MSAWIVSKQHINAMVFVLGRGDSIPEGMTPDELGRMLWRENVNSVSCRYRGEPIGDLPGPIGLTEEAIDGYTYTEPVTKPVPGQVGQIFGCYSYQSCEHPEWEASMAKAICDAVEKATADVPVVDGPWGWDTH